MKFKPRQYEIEAKQLPAAGEPADEFVDWMHETGLADMATSERDESLCIQSPHGDMLARPNDWVIKYEDGVFAVCPPDLFDKYFEVSES